mgnify:CR=1 FL=1
MTITFATEIEAAERSSLRCRIFAAQFQAGRSAMPLGFGWA